LSDLPKLSDDKEYSLNYLPFTEAMLPHASILLADRHRRHRASLPELPARFEDPQAAARALATVLRTPNARGFAALRDGEVIAYLIGETTPQPWARCGYSNLPGYGLAPGESPQIIQDLYALLGETWNQHGCFNHYVYVSAADTDLVGAWFDLGFGKERVDALLDVRTAKIPEAALAPGIEIRRVFKGDNHFLASLSDTIWRQQAMAPRWHPITPEEAMLQPEGWAEIADTPSDMAYLALKDQQALGSLAFYVEDEADGSMTTPPNCRYMTAAATRDAARGRGIGTALTWHGLKQIREHGEAYCLTNWQSANLLAARFWPRFGFRPVAFRLARTINPMIAWAKG